LLSLLHLLIGATAAWPLAARAQQLAMPVVGFLRSTPAAGFEYLVNALRQGLNDAGFVEGRNVAVGYRWADNQPDRLLGLAADLVSRQVAAIVASGPGAVQAAKAAATTTPIIFVIGADPVRTGLVANLNRPGGNTTGVVFTLVDLAAKLLGLLHELVPKASSSRVRATVLPVSRAQSARLEGSGACHRSANPDSERRTRAGVQCRLCNGRASGRRRAGSSALAHTS
jgi:ABC-type uncharacterized transport system substrate-binding protein